ncbi:MAG TPA: right-handed parallel beta-helix repeat-containing protein [Phycisphaerae bacterium]|nr:right-handed parallel beta-helix repeat-containing protein [Phycisphaerae bacterium]HRY71367.1 right-handed parallel beta-helix repeat-containing protein [Phycisphaerae bacterium]HSA29711.1 right-handed parallel beta-helix repeat-containing protein [Phycisphaerae bacterium]
MSLLRSSCVKASVWVVAAFLGVCPASGQRVLYVATTGDDAGDGLSWATAKRTVQAGLDAAVDGDQVWVAAGTYVECITLKAGAGLYGGFAGNETALTQRNWTANPTILDGNQQGSVVTSPEGATATTRINGFTITNGDASHGGGIFCSWDSSPTIANNTITGNNSTQGGGGIYSSNSSPTIANNTITRNGSYWGDGIGCSGGSPTIVNNTITANTGSSSSSGDDRYVGVIGCVSASSAVISNNVIAGNGGDGVHFFTSSGVISNNTIVGNDGCGISSVASGPAISNNIVAFNFSGIDNASGTPSLRNNCVYNPARANYAGISPGAGDFSADPQLVAVEYGQVHLTGGSPCIDAGDDSIVPFGSVDVDGQTRIQGAHVDIGADEFSGTPPPPFTPTIVRVSPSGHDVNDGSSWLSAKLTVQAGIDAASSVGGEVWVARGTYGEGITLRPWVYVYGGFAGTESSRDERDWAANASILDGGAVGAFSGYRVSRIDGFTIRNSGGGVGIDCGNSSPTITNNTIVGNTGIDCGGGINCWYSSPMIANNTIAGNTAWGAFGGWGAGIGCVGGSPTIVNNMITGNIAGGVDWSGGGGIACWKSSPTIANNIIAFNSSGIEGGDASLIRYNCVYANRDYDYSNPFTDPTGTNGNISVDPLFVRNPSGGGDGWGDDPWTYDLDEGANDDYGDLRLRPGSPCIDAGDNAAVPIGVTTDLASRPRFFDDPTTADCPYAPETCGTAPIVDMGAYEFAPVVTADLDGDGDVDATDFGIFQACVSGPAIPHNGTRTCQTADFDHDGDVDQDDFGIFQRCYSGPGKLPERGCEG